MGALTAFQALRMAPATIKIHNFIVLAAPLVSPIWPGDIMANIVEYPQIHDFLRNPPPSSPPLVLISVAGGDDRELMIEESQTDLRRIFKVENNKASSISNGKMAWITTAAPSLPQVRKHADHQCILWCRELVIAMATAITAVETAFAKGLKLEEILSVAQSALDLKANRIHPTTALDLPSLWGGAHICQTWTMITENASQSAVVKFTTSEKLV